MDATAHFDNSVRGTVLTTSGIFRISVSSGGGAVGVKGSGMWWKELGPPQKRNHFVPKMIFLGAFCHSFL